MTDELKALVARLRKDSGPFSPHIDELLNTAADAIEALAAELDEARSDLNRTLYPTYAADVASAVEALAARAEAAEAKLAKKAEMMIGGMGREIFRLRTALEAAEARLAAVREAVLVAWDSLPVGYHSYDQIERWLNSDQMKVAIKMIRALSTPKPGEKQ